MLGFSLGLTKSVASSWLSVSSVVCVVGFDIMGIPVVGVRLGLTLVVVFVFADTIFVVSFVMATSISVVTWLFALVTCRLGFFRVWFSGILPHIISLQFIWRFQTFQF